MFIFSVYLRIVKCKLILVCLALFLSNLLVSDHTLEAFPVLGPQSENTTTDSLPPKSDTFRTPPPPCPPPPLHEPEYFKVAEEMPLFPGGEGETPVERRVDSEKRMMNFIHENLKFPTIARNCCVQGIVVINFLIEEDGRIHTFKLLRDPGCGLGEEAMRVMHKMAEMHGCWTPGKHQGQPVKMQYNIPIRICLDRVAKPTPPPPPPAPPRPQACDELWTTPEIMPYFDSSSKGTYSERRKAGERALLEFLYSHLKYPEEAARAEAEGVAVISFRIDTSGRMLDLEIVRDPGNGMGCEAMRVADKLANCGVLWEPGRLMPTGQPVPVQFNLPIKFKLGEHEISYSPCLSEEDAHEPTATENVATDIKSTDFEPFTAQFATLSEGIRVSYQIEKTSTLHVFDISGRLVWNCVLQPGQATQLVPLNQRGVYAFRIDFEGGGEVYKIAY